MTATTWHSTPNWTLLARHLSWNFQRMLRQLHSWRCIQTVPYQSAVAEFFSWDDLLFMDGIMINRGDWLGSPANIKGANKDAKIYVRRSATLHNLLFCPNTLCMNYVTNTFLLVSSSISGKQLLCFVQGHGQKSEQKHATKNLDEFHNHSPLLTKLEYSSTHYRKKEHELFSFLYCDPFPRVFLILRL